MKTDLELALECAINIYHQYAIKYPIDDYLSKPEFSELLKENAKPFLHSTIPPNTTVDDYISKLFTRADGNHNGRLKFTEFLTTLNLVVIDAHNRSHPHPRSHDRHPDAGQEHDHGHGHDHGHDHGPAK
ncbi:PREDICTED: protein S100-A9-like [Fulmarus glacialis]|uniref:protein S100-A9-like n=1 Tax=Fulmarus glacialis TaxID=30455 RepID=UPI00051B0B9B|nr:PREDICTED: protein S100-A9-like [Fulmarus glacialis]